MKKFIQSLLFAGFLCQGSSVVATTTSNMPAPIKCKCEGSREQLVISNGVATCKGKGEFAPEDCSCPEGYIIKKGKTSILCVFS